MARCRLVASACGAAVGLALLGCRTSAERAAPRPSDPRADASSLADAHPSTFAQSVPLDGADASFGAPPRARERSGELRVVAAQVDVRTGPSIESPKLGTLRAGGIARLRDAQAFVAPSADCESGWYAVLPDGFLCEGDGVTRDTADRASELLSDYALAAHAALPASYGFAEGAPIYARLPSTGEQARAEPGLDDHLQKLKAEPTETLAAPDVPNELCTASLAPSRPKPLTAGAPVVGFLERLSKVAWVAEFATEQRRWLLTPELLLIPSDRVERAVISGFHGVEVPASGGVAMTGHQAVPRYAKSDDGRHFVPLRDAWPANSPVMLAEPALRWSDDKFLETAERGVFVRATDVLVAHPAPPSRWGLEPDARFIEVVARTNLLLMHDGDRVTYVTLVSVGKEGAPRGKFRVFSKHLTAPSLLELPHAVVRGAEIPEVMRMTDTPDRPSEVTAVPLFAAWWSNAWGSQVAGIGIAVAPLDARRLFDTTEPALPDGWHSIRGEGTWVIIHD